LKKKQRELRSGSEVRAKFGEVVVCFKSQLLTCRSVVTGNSGDISGEDSLLVVDAPVDVLVLDLLWLSLLSAFALTYRALSRCTASKMFR
jgi:hypothetical protein